MKALLITIVGFALLLCPLTAAAQGTKNGGNATCTDKAKAKRDFVKGRLAYRRGDYEDAILKWQDSYAACQKPLTLFNIGNAYERLGDLKAALKHLEEYRPQAEKHEQADLDSRLASLKTRIAEQDKLEAERLANEKEKEDALRKAEEDRKRREQAGKGDGTGTLRLAGWITGAAGVAALIGGAVTGGLALSLDGDLKDSCTDGNCPPGSSADIDQLDTLSITTDVLLVVGGALTAGGVLMWLLDQPSDSSTSVGLTLVPGLYGASVRQSF